MEDLGRLASQRHLRGLRASVRASRELDDLAADRTGEVVIEPSGILGELPFELVPLGFA